MPPTRRHRTGRLGRTHDKEHRRRWGDPEFTPEAGDDVFEKRLYDAFHKTGLDAHLRSRGVDRVVTGLYTEMCARHTSASAFFNDYEIAVPTDCVTPSMRKTTTEVSTTR
jgi:nicotinamidase-related amidase